MHSPADPVAAVLAADFTLGYFYKILLDLEPACGDHGVLGESCRDKNYHNLLRIVGRANVIKNISLLGHLCHSGRREL